MGKKQKLPKYVYRVRSTLDEPICFDPELQITEDGGFIEMGFFEEELALLALFSEAENARKHGRKLKIVKEKLDPKTLEWVLTEDDIHQKAIEEKQKGEA